jgi:hypothetical protein
MKRRHFINSKYEFTCFLFDHGRAARLKCRMCGLSDEFPLDVSKDLSHLPGHLNETARHPSV